MRRQKAMTDELHRDWGQALVGCYEHSVNMLEITRTDVDILDAGWMMSRFDICRVAIIPGHLLRPWLHGYDTRPNSTSLLKTNGLP